MNETKLIHGDCLEKLKELPENSVDSIVTDPPYGLSFMGKKWDYDVPSVEVWAECLRVLKPGGHLLAFAGTRTQHRMAVRIEDAGFEIRDMIAWIYGSGFPKSLDVSKAIDKAAGAEREVIGQWKPTGTARPSKGGSHSAAKTTSDCGYDPDETAMVSITAPATEAAKQWQGWGTALKPALEPITVARKPLIGTVAENVLQHGTGAINVDGGRVGERWPANFIHDGSNEVDFVFSGGASDLSTLPDLNRQVSVGGRSSSPARFFYCAKTSKKDRGDGNGHPTVKPTDLMRYLCRLVTPSKGIVLDPFMGSGSTGKAAIMEGFNFIGIEREKNYMEIAQARINSAKTPA